MGKATVGYVMIFLGVASALYSLFGIYIFFQVTSLLYFLKSDFTGLLLLFVMALVSIFLSWYGFRMLRGRCKRTGTR